MKIFFVAQLNARLQPVHRGEYFEDPLNVELKKAECGEVSGGGSLQSKIGEIEYCDIEIEVNGALTVAERVVIETLEGLGAPKGSKLHIEAEGRQVQFGQAEGIAVYLNGTGLPDEVYKECDSNFVYSEFDRLLNGEGRVQLLAGAFRDRVLHVRSLVSGNELTPHRISCKLSTVRPMPGRANRVTANPSIEGMPKRLRLSVTPHVKR
ncbi:MAG TPA: hypothetical protein PLV36_15645 [Zoogloea sp.]|nr:hypothetical protein [Zoogloea sp.]